MRAHAEVEESAVVFRRLPKAQMHLTGLRIPSTPKRSLDAGAQRVVAAANLLLDFVRRKGRKPQIPPRDGQTPP